MIAAAHLQIAIRPAQTTGSVLRHGLRFRYKVDPNVAWAIDAQLTCDGQDAGVVSRPVRRAHKRTHVPVMNIAVRRILRSSDAVTCRLVVLAYDKHVRVGHPLAIRRTHVTLRT